MQGQSAANAAGFQASVARNQAIVDQNNAIAAEQNADYAGKVGLANATRESMKGAAKSARIKAAYAANNIDPNTGSAVDVRESQAEINKLDAENVLSDAELRAYGYRSDAANFRNKSALSKASGGMYDRAGSDALTGSYFKAGGTLLAGLSSYGKWGDMFGSSTGNIDKEIANWSNYSVPGAKTY